MKRARERNQRYVLHTHTHIHIPPLLFPLCIHSSMWLRLSKPFSDTSQSRQSELEQKLQDPSQSATRKEQLWSTAGRKEGQYLRFLRTKDKPENYNTVKIIGKGAFGEVKLVQKKGDGKVYAMKSLIKTEMFKKDQLAHVRSERDILAESDSPWVVKLYTTFQDAYFLYMLMEFLPGGDLMTMLIKYEIFSEDITRFYIAEIVLAIEAVHKLGFIHRSASSSSSCLPVQIKILLTYSTCRDIKPDNILLDRGGHVKLTDFGLSTGFHRLHDNNYYQQLLQGRSNRPRDRSSVAIDQINLTVSNRSQINDWRRSRRLMAYSTVGTPDYIAPEIFTGHGYSFDCDWWSLGTIMFECLVGWPPFCAEDSHDTYRKIVNWRQTLYFPDDITLGIEAENLIRRLANLLLIPTTTQLMCCLVWFVTLRTVLDGGVPTKSRTMPSSVVSNLTVFVVSELHSSLA